MWKPTSTIHHHHHRHRHSSTAYLPTYLPAGAMAQARDTGRAAAAVDAATVPVPDSSSEASADEYPVPLSAPTVFRPPALQAQCLPTVSAPLSAPTVSVLQRHGGRPSHHPHCQLIHQLIQDQLRAQETQQPQTSEPVILFPWPQRLECLMRPPSWMRRRPSGAAGSWAPSPERRRGIC